MVGFPRLQAREEVNLFDYSFELAKSTERPLLLFSLCLLAVAVGLLWRTD